ncbi:hypothetical protein LguiA_018989 [Lonicera macranthoides]
MSPSSSSSSEEKVSLLYLSSFFLRRHGPPRNLAETAPAVRHACRGLAEVVVEKKLGGHDGLNDGIATRVDGPSDGSKNLLNDHVLHSEDTMFSQTNMQVYNEIYNLIMVRDFIIPD